MASPSIGNFNVAAKSLVDLSHLQETVVWVVNQIHRHQDEIAAVQSRHDIDFPKLELQIKKCRHFTVNKRYEKYRRECEGDGFGAFKAEWLKGKAERSKWTKACRHSRKISSNKVMRLWEEDWQYNKRCRQLIRFSLRSIRRNRLDAAVGIWFWVWQINKRYNTIVRNSNQRRNDVHKIKGLAGFFNQWKRKKRHRWIVKKLTQTREQRIESKILSAWKFLVDFRRIRATKIQYKLMKGERMIKFNVFHGWDDVIQTQKRHRALIKRTTRYRNARRLERAIEDWDFYVQYAKKQRLLQIDEDDVIERMATMEGCIDGIVRKDRIRPMELECAIKLVKNLNDLKLNTSVKEVQDALGKKVDKPTEEQVARRTVRMWKTGVTDKSTDKTTPALGKFQSALNAKKEQRAKEDFDARAVEDHQAALTKGKKAVGGQPAIRAAPANDAQLAGGVSAAAKELADAVTTADDSSNLPRSPHRVLLEKQFRRELQDSAGRMVSGIAASIKRRMGDDDAGSGLPSSAGAYLSPSRAREMALRDALSSEQEVDAAMRDMRAAEIDAAVRDMHPGMAHGHPHPRLSAAEMDVAMRDSQGGHVDRFALEAAMRGDAMDRRLTEELRVEEALRMDAGAAAAAAAGMPMYGGPGSPGGLARARLEVQRLSSELSREAVSGVETYLGASSH